MGWCLDRAEMGLDSRVVVRGSRTAEELANAELDEVLAR
jgi:hypothetical protein